MCDPVVLCLFCLSLRRYHPENHDRDPRVGERDHQYRMQHGVTRMPLWEDVRAWCQALAEAYFDRLDAVLWEHERRWRCVLAERERTLSEAGTHLRALCGLLCPVLHVPTDGDADADVNDPDVALVRMGGRWLGCQVLVGMLVRVRTVAPGGQPPARNALGYLHAMAVFTACTPAEDDVAFLIEPDPLSVEPLRSAADAERYLPRPDDNEWVTAEQVDEGSEGS